MKYDNEKAPVFLQRLHSFMPVVNNHDGLKTATFFTMRYRTNAKFRCPHNNSLLSGCYMVVKASIVPEKFECSSKITAQFYVGKEKREHSETGQPSTESTVFNKTAEYDGLNDVFMQVDYPRSLK
jgi:hypothetical protein